MGQNNKWQVEYLKTLLDKAREQMIHNRKAFLYQAKPPSDKENRNFSMRLRAKGRNSFKNNTSILGKTKSK